ncbi:hypothetical protein OXPF_16880 [Oxobacter pfennigii]|uniref:Uncharacterized protein n=1 Tax=Oxobacter pfennigii TaxID=36849 RepID=A0A0P8YBX1_9CLOT|nr:hypothetical protein [Oxobacter pfennigii]KPU44605.1 hypothetical protein OXPF_16880 [Oxobacter pfennigii]
MNSELHSLSFNESNAGEFIKHNAQKIFAFILLSTIIFILFFIFNFMILIPSYPESTAKQYVNCIMNKKYQDAIEYYTYEIDEPALSHNFLLKYLENKYKNANSINVLPMKEFQNGLEKTFYLEITQGGNKVTESITLINTDSSLLGIKKTWKIIFPYHTKSIDIKGANGSEVYLDDIFLGEIRDGILKADNVIEGLHYIKSYIPGVGQSEVIEIDTGKDGDDVLLKINLYPEFERAMEKLVRDFCSGWSEYCLTQNPEKIKPYLTDSLFNIYTYKDGRFNGSKYELSDNTISFVDISLKDSKTIHYTVDEKWHIKEAITDPGLTFEINRKETLEQIQYMKWKYYIINENGTWKIDSADQLSFNQEIVE